MFTQFRVHLCLALGQRGPPVLQCEQFGVQQRPHPQAFARAGEQPVLHVTGFAEAAAQAGDVRAEVRLRAGRRIDFDLVMRPRYAEDAVQLTLFTSLLLPRTDREREARNIRSRPSGQQRIRLG